MNLTRPRLTSTFADWIGCHARCKQDVSAVWWDCSLPSSLSDDITTEPVGFFSRSFRMLKVPVVYQCEDELCVKVWVMKKLSEGDYNRLCNRYFMFNKHSNILIPINLWYVSITPTLCHRISFIFTVEFIFSPNRSDWRPRWANTRHMTRLRHAVWTLPSPRTPFKQAFAFYLFPQTAQKNFCTLVSTSNTCRL